MNLLKLIGVDVNEKSIRKVKRIVEVDLGDPKGHKFRDTFEKEDIRRVKQKDNRS